MKLLLINLLITLTVYSSFINQTDAFLTNWLKDKIKEIKDDFSDTKDELVSDLKEFVSVQTR
jgi:hypothetical protein